MAISNINIKKREEIDRFITENRDKYVCGCGCGIFITIRRDHWRLGIPKYIHGHHSRVNNPFSGRNHSDIFKASRRGDGNSNWHGGRYHDTQGYVRVLSPLHRYVDCKGYVKEHIVMLVKENGDIKGGNVIHHINGVKDDNRIENLISIPNNEHSSFHNTKYVESDDLKWANLWYDNMSYTEISKMVGVNVCTISVHIKKFIKKYPRPEWAITQIFRASGLLEDVSKSGCGHPNAASVKFLDPNGTLGLLIHGCDGCCYVENDDST